MAYQHPTMSLPVIRFLTGIEMEASAYSAEVNGLPTKPLRKQFYLGCLNGLSFMRDGCVPESGREGERVARHERSVNRIRRRGPMMVAKTHLKRTKTNYPSRFSFLGAHSDQ